MLHLHEREPEKGPEKPNAFNGIRQVPGWQVLMEIIIEIAAVITIIEFLMRFLAE